MMTLARQAGLALTFTFVFCVLSLLWLIPYLRKKKMGQRILQIGPAWHAPKEGTPTMGGIAFLPLCLLGGAMLCWLHGDVTPGQQLYPFWITLLFAIANGAIGILDDLTKFRHARNEGLTPTQKLILQTVCAAAYLALLRLWGGTDSTPVLFGIALDLGPFRYFVFLLLLVGVTNCANLTDGIDGLAAAVATVILTFFTALAVLQEQTAAAWLGALLLGASAAFLLFNRHPARIFMGDTGSLFLGAGAAGVAFLLERPYSILLCGAVYLLEGASVILQVWHFKRTRRRLFLMAPLHHHFERCGWSEDRIVWLFSAMTLLACCLAYLLI